MCGSTVESVESSRVQGGGFIWLMVVGSAVVGIFRRLLATIIEYTT